MSKDELNEGLVSKDESIKGSLLNLLDIMDCTPPRPTDMMDPVGAADTVGERRGFIGETPAEKETGDDEPEALPLLDFYPKAGERDKRKSRGVIKRLHFISLLSLPEWFHPLPAWHEIACGTLSSSIAQSACCNHQKDTRRDGPQCGCVCAYAG